MRIIIDIDPETMPVHSQTGDEGALNDGGGPPEALLAELGASSRGGQEGQGGDASEAADGGPPPAWLVEVIGAAAEADSGAFEVGMPDEPDVDVNGGAPTLE
jgi:hypothetical protein